MWWQLFWIGAFAIECVLLFFMVYFLIMVSDLEVDHVNPREFSRRMSQWAPREVVVHVAFTLSVLLVGSWGVFLVNAPLAAFHGYKLFMKMYAFDVTEAHLREKQKQWKREFYVKLGFYLLLFFLMLYKMVVALVEGISRSSSSMPDVASMPHLQ